MKTKAFIVDAREFKIGFCKGGVWTSLPMPDDELTKFLERLREMEIFDPIVMVYDASAPYKKPIKTLWTEDNRLGLVELNRLLLELGGG
ncbi:hypothetical protein M5W68_19315 [Paenibacillus larvae]|uniref:hypothetical protein n=1 Tax=Paenibacillus larvae TaxID=1464 RepID=UPI0022817EB4|nr:hypothetical protein [Paenibacillus larvae]MCY9512366.1 hypothetical protein [Paenibacillus larvae]MCY9527199.1 hypothetical protein [Paenibacillus larvae]